ncbi:MAG: S41 family peptidase [Clostridia bacterium]|nr:S41 family peptidase [Clostridia bacterium]
MIKIRKSTLVFLVVLGVLAGMSCFYGLQEMGVLSRLGFSGSHSLAGDEYQEYTHLKETYGKVDELRSYILDNYYVEVDEEALDTGILRGVFQGLDDVYSYYMTPSEYEQQMVSLTGVYSGIGVTISAGDSGYVEVVAPTKGSPAEAAGVRKGDLIIAVDGVEYTAAQLDVCAAEIRGPEGTDVTLTLRRKDEIFDVTITRTTIISQTVEYEMLANAIGYIAVSGFEQKTADQFEEALNDLEAQGAKSLILDLRDNGGGLVDAAVKIADMLLDQGVVAYTQDHDGNKGYYRTKNGKTDLPYVVLVNDGSASASEILSAGIKDNGGGPLVGVTTYGKGIIQTVEQLTDGSGIKMTILQYFSPNGSVIHKQGIEPDYVVELTEDCYDEDGELVNDLQLKKAIELLKP